MKNEEQVHYQIPQWLDSLSLIQALGCQTRGHLEHTLAMMSVISFSKKQKTKIRASEYTHQYTAECKYSCHP